MVAVQRWARSDPNPLGALLRGHRERRQLDVKALGSMSGVSQSLLSLCEQGRKNLGHASVQKVAAAFAPSEPEVNEFMDARGDDTPAVEGRRGRPRAGGTAGARGSRL